MQHTDMDSEEDPLCFCYQFKGSPEATQLVAKHDNLKMIALTEPNIWHCLLPGAVRSFGRGLAEWEYPILYFIDMILRTDSQENLGLYDEILFGKDYNPPFEDFPLLYSLFYGAECPIDAITVGDCWLDLLQKAGYDIPTYLEAIQALHDEPEIIPFAWRGPLTFLCEFEPRPKLYWDWHFDPDSPAHLLRTTFKEVAMQNNGMRLDSFRLPGWERLWPFSAPLWATCDHPFPCMGQTYMDMCYETKCRIRAERTERKRIAKLARGSKLAKHRVPGAWPCGYGV